MNFFFVTITIDIPDIPLHSFCGTELLTLQFNTYFKMIGKNHFIVALSILFTLTLFSKEVGVNERELLDLLWGGGGGGGGAFVSLPDGWSRRLLMLLLLLSNPLLKGKSKISDKNDIVCAVWI